MVDRVYGLVGGWFENYERYMRYLYNKWVVLVVMGGVVEVYRRDGMCDEVKKEKNE